MASSKSSNNSSLCLTIQIEYLLAQMMYFFLGSILFERDRERQREIKRLKVSVPSPCPGRP